MSSPSPSDDSMQTHHRHIFVANLPISAPLPIIEHRVMALLSPHGNIVTVRARLDKSNLPIAFVTFKDPVDLTALCQEVLCFEGRRLRVEPCRERVTSPPLNPPGLDFDPPAALMNKVLLSGINLSCLHYRHILRHLSHYGRITDIYVPQPGVAADPALLPPFTVLVEYEGEGEARAAVGALHESQWAGWRVVAALTAMPMPDI